MVNMYGIIDGYSHISPPRYTEILRQQHPDFYNGLLGMTPPLYDMETRFRIMDEFGPLSQVLTIGPVPPLEAFATPRQARELAKVANEEMAELVSRHPERFIAAIALLPMNDVEAAVEEAERAVKTLGLRGVYLHTNISGRPLDAPEFLPLFEMMADYDLPIYIHPWRSDDYCGDYSTESESKYAIASTFGWPFETTAAMTRLVFSGILERYPTLKIVTHHLGGIVTLLSERIVQHYGQKSSKVHDYEEWRRDLSEAPIEYFKRFYVDTAIHGNTPALMLGRSFFGSTHMIFGTDMPLGDPAFGKGSYPRHIEAIRAMDIPEEERRMIFGENVRRLLRL